MQAAYDASFAAHARCSELLQSHLWHSHPRIEMLGFPIFDDVDENENGLDGNQLDTMWLDVIAEDFQSDQQAAPVILTADDTLQRFAKGVLKKAPGLEPGFGPTYGGSTGRPVHLTTLLRAGTNTLRHVSEWDDTPLLQRLPYPTLAEVPLRSTLLRDAVRNIAVLQRAFGIGLNDLIRNPVSCRVLVLIDGQLGTAAPSYTRFEGAVVLAAQDIARHAGSEAVARLDFALAGNDLLATCQWH